MNKINRRLNNGTGGLPHSSTQSIPKFTFPPTSLTNLNKIQETANSLWKDGVLSTRSLLDICGHDFDMEKQRIEKEEKEGAMRPMETKTKSENEPSDPNNKEGRPEVDDDERTSDKGKAESGKAPKPSNPEGSEA